MNCLMCLDTKKITSGSDEIDCPYCYEFRQKEPDSVKYPTEKEIEEKLKELGFCGHEAAFSTRAAKAIAKFLVDYGRNQ